MNHKLGGCSQAWATSAITAGFARQFSRSLATFLAAAVVCASSVAQPTAAYTDPSNLGPARYQTVGIQWIGHLISHPNEPVGAEQVQEVRGHTNLIGLVHSPEQPRQNDGALDALGPDIGALLFVDKVFQGQDGRALDPLTVAANLVGLRLTVQRTRSSVRFLAFDESMWKRQRSYCGSDLSCSGNGPVAAVTQEMLPQIEWWIRQLRVLFPDTGVVYVLAHAMVRPGNVPLPVNADFYAFNCYSERQGCSHDQATGLPYSLQVLFNSVKTGVTALNHAYGGFRRLALVPPSFMAFDRSAPRQETGWAGNAELVIDLQLTTPGQNPDTAALALLQRNLAFAADPMVGMVGTFVWNTFHEGELTFYGARGLPQVRAYLEQQGRMLLHRGAVPNTSPPVIEFFATPQGLSDTGSIWTWATSHATSCRSVTEEASGALQNMPPNGVVYRPSRAAPIPAYTIECTGPNGTRRKNLITVSP